MENISLDKLNTLYHGEGFFDQYGGSVVVTMLTFLAFFVIVSYFYVMKRILPLRANWNANKCNPMVIPFAGVINNDPTKGVWETTNENFSYCVSNILTQVASDALQPIYYTLHVLTSGVADIGNDIQQTRKKISTTVDNMEHITQNVMGRLMNFTTPLHRTVIRIKDILDKTSGILATGILTGITGFLATSTFVGAFIELMIIGLVILTAIIVPLLFFFFTIPFAAPFLAIYIYVVVRVAMVLHRLGKDTSVSTKRVPRTP